MKASLMSCALLLGLAGLALPGTQGGPNAREGGPPEVEGKVFLNHLYLVLDKDTYQAIGASDFLRHEFAGGRQATNKTADGSSWTGTYLYGEQTYFELFAEGAMGKEGTSGVGLGVDHKGGIEDVARRLGHAGAPAPVKLQVRLHEGKKIPWFYAVDGPKGGAQDVLETWVMEYHPDFLAQWHPDLRPGEAGITRRHYQARRFKAERYLKDIVGVTIALDGPEAGRFAALLQPLGYRLTRVGDRTVATGPDVTFTVVPAGTGARGVVELRLALQRTKEGEKSLRFGNRSVLTFPGDRTAVWKF